MARTLKSAVKSAATLKSNTGNRGRTPKAPDQRTVRVPFERRDLLLILSVMDGDTPPSAIITGEPPAAPIMPSDDGTAAEWRAYALAKDSYAADVDKFAMQNLAASRIRRASNAALNGERLRAPRKSSAVTSNKSK